MNCLICTKHKEPLSPLIYEGQHALLVHYHCTAENPKMYKGYLFVESRRHVPSYAELSEAEAAEIGTLISKAAKLLKQSLGAEHIYTFTISDLVPHLHVHIIPRYPKTPKEYWGGRKLIEWPDAPLIDSKEIQRISEELRLKF